ncbi:hypothetical protein [Oceanisphaera sp. IT1-181]|uniref:hypothetical protein n=1 Tax=Oceanisphaera sp. IT1-181 TaxID=3081199 RepID=UPI0029C9DAE3|nr:hypothetical protein [Oceanisphaera sp. IT1-181]
MTRKGFGQFDKSTGEVIEGFVAFVAPKRVNGFGKEWLAMSQAAALMFAKSDLSASDMKVFFALLAKLDFENLLVLNQSEIAREIDMDRHNMNRSIRKLLALEVLFEGPRIGVSRSYRLNPNMGWKGSASNHRKALDDRMKTSGLSVIKGGIA